MPTEQPAPGTQRRRGPQPRHTRQDVIRAAVAIADADGLDAVTIRAVAGRLGTGVMSLYNYVPDKQTLVYDMVEEVSGELGLPEPSGDWRADMHLLAGQQQAVLRRHPWMIEATSHLQPLGPPSWPCWNSRWARWSLPGWAPVPGWRRSAWSTGS